MLKTKDKINFVHIKKHSLQFTPKRGAVHTVAAWPFFAYQVKVLPLSATETQTRALPLHQLVPASNRELADYYLR